MKSPGEPSHHAWIGMIREILQQRGLDAKQHAILVRRLVTTPPDQNRTGEVPCVIAFILIAAKPSEIGGRKLAAEG
jgi:hypothetical protein